MNKGILFKNRDEWRSWLDSNHLIEKHVWLIYFKKHSLKNSVAQPDAVEEALCYGWIDSIVRRIDEEKYMQKFTPRNEKSIWSDINKKRVALLIKNSKMTKAGMKKVRAAKKNGYWNKLNDNSDIKNIPVELEIALSKNERAHSNFNQLAASHKKHYIYWIATAKKEETRIRRTLKAIQLLERNEKLGMV
jgi:uncharacterized protein YdeI (YjbR/CyaY-like superfamily)